MTKKEQELQNRLLDVIEANTQTVEALHDLLLKMANPPITMIPNDAELDIKPGRIEAPPGRISDDGEDTNPTGLALHGETPPEEPVAEVNTEITPEYCRKALKAITKKTSTKEAKAFMAKFGDAKTIPQLDKKYYEEFIEGATRIMNGPKREGK